MYTIKDYLKFYKDISFEDVSFNEIDNILFSELSYLTWKDIVNKEKIKLLDAINLYLDKNVIYKLEPWQIIHFRIADKDFYPYGGSLLKSGIKTYNRLQLLEDGMVIYRMARIPERRVFKIPVGNLPKNEALRYVQKIKDSYRTSQVLDEKGNIERESINYIVN